MSTVAIIDRLVSAHERQVVAHSLSPSARQALAVAALAGSRPISTLSAQHQVSRKFI